MHPLRAHLEAVMQVMRSAPDIKLQGRNGNPPILRLDPPASAATLADLERRLGPLPSTLVEVLGQVSGHIEMDWFGVAGDSGYDITASLLLSPESLVKVASWPEEYFRLRPEVADDPEEVEFHQRYWPRATRGIPVLVAPNFDFLCIDLQQPGEKLIYISVNGTDDLMLDLTLPRFLTHLTWLEPWPDWNQIERFATEDVPLNVDPPMRRLRFDAEGPEGTAFRKKVWKGRVSRPSEVLLERG